MVVSKNYRLQIIVFILLCEEGRLYVLIILGNILRPQLWAGWELSSRIIIKFVDVLYFNESTLGTVVKCERYFF